MTLWFLFALMTAAAIFAVLWPLARKPEGRAAGDVAGYRDQIDEIARGRAAGPIGEAQVEAHLEQNPEDGRGWEVIAPVYLRYGRFEEAVKARRNALRLNGASAQREADLGEALMGAANGVVTDEAKAAFERALTHDAR